MTHYRWIYLAGAAALVCSSVAVADTSHGPADSTSGVISGSSNQQGDDQGDGLHQAKGHDRDDAHGKSERGKGKHEKAHHGDDDRVRNHQGDVDDQDNGPQGSGPPVTSKPVIGNPGSTTGTPGVGNPHSVGSVGVPEPGTAALLTAGFLGFAVRRLRRRAVLRDQ